MGLVSSKRGYIKWGKSKGVNKHTIQLMIKDYEKETGIDLRSNAVYYTNQQTQINESCKRFYAFVNWATENISK